MDPSHSLPTEDQDDQCFSLPLSMMNLSPSDSPPTTLDGCPMGSQFTRGTQGDSLSSESVQDKDDPHLPSVPSSSPTLEPAAAKDNYSSVLFESGRGAQEEDPEQPSAYKLSDKLDYLTEYLSSQRSPLSLEQLSSFIEWLSCSSSSSEHLKEESDSTFTLEPILMPSKDTGVPSTSTFSSSMVGAGLVNLGNTCFINAILQCFTHTVPLIQGLCSCSHPVPCDYDIHGFCVLCGLRDHIRLSLATSRGILSPWSLVDNLKHFSPSFRRYQQEDAHEFMLCFLDKLRRCSEDWKKKNQSCGQDGNLVEKVFGGSLISKLRCGNCGHCSDTHEPLIGLSLGIENVDNLISALESFMKLEAIDAKLICDGCNGEEYMEKQLMLGQAPSVAAIQLKRFQTVGTSVEKIDKYVNFPLELDLRPYTRRSEDNNVELKYDLYAIVVHTGFSSTSGHYFCFVRTAPDMWHRLDDSEVTRVEGDFVLSQEAYLLFYAKQGTPWFSSVMEASLLCLDVSIPKSILDTVDSTYSSVTNISDSDTDVLPEWCYDYPEVDDVLHASRVPGQFPSRLNHENAGFSGSRDDTSDIQMLCRSSIISNGNSCNEGNDTPSNPDQNNSFHEVINIREDNDFCPLTPPSPPSPDAYSPDMNYYIPRDHLKMENHESCKRRFDRSMEDSKRKAIRYGTKSMPVSRRRKLLDAMMGPNSEGSLNKRRKRMNLSLCKKVSPRRVCRKSNHGSVMHGPVMACQL